MAVAGKDTKVWRSPLAMAPGDDENRILGACEVRGPEKTRDFYHDVRTETKKVTTPSWKKCRRRLRSDHSRFFYRAAISLWVDLVWGTFWSRLMHWLAHR